MIIYMIILFIVGILLGHIYTKVGIALGKKGKINFKCDSCNHDLKLFEHLYIFRRFSNKGRCKYCNERVATSNAFFELLTGILFALAYFVNKDSDMCILNTILYLLVFSCLMIIIASDYHHMIIPDIVLIVLSIIIIVFKILIGFYNEDLTGIMDTGYMLIFMIMEAIIVFIVMFILQKASSLIFKSNSLGFGDVKLMAVLALILGYKMCIVCLFISCFMALPVAIYNLQKKDRKLLPFGPYLAFGTIILLLCQIDFNMIIDFIRS